MMTSADSRPQPDCQSEDVAAYLDGELSAEAAARFEQHLKNCAPCAMELQQQRRLLCTLDFALGGATGDDLPLPGNFSQIVTVHAQSDLSSLRSERAEHGRALRLCLLLAAGSFALLGGSVISEKVFKPLGLLLRHAGTILAFGWRALYDFGAGLAVIARAIGGHTIFESYRLAPLVLLLLVISVVLLPRLISSYHRTHTGLEDAAPRVESSS